MLSESIIGLTQTDEVQGAQAKWNELYEQYYERHFAPGNEEMRRFRKSYIILFHILTTRTFYYMKRILFVIATLAIILLGLYFYIRTSNIDVLDQTQDVASSTVDTVTIDEDATVIDTFTTYSNPEFGVEFTYPDGPSGYVLDESISANPDTGLVHTIVLMRAEDAENSLPIDSEGPPTITLQIFNNTDNQLALGWAETFSLLSNFNLKTSDVTQSTVDGANAISYMADGLYTSDNVVVTQGEHVYMVSEMFTDSESQLRNDFLQLVESIRFIPYQIPNSTPVGQGKLDINAVCEGALAYMTFPDGESADVFVAECKEGEHPEVIEQYKVQMSLEEGVAL